MEPATISGETKQECPWVIWKATESTKLREQKKERHLEIKIEMESHTGATIMVQKYPQCHSFAKVSAENCSKNTLTNIVTLQPLSYFPTALIMYFIIHTSISVLIISQFSHG